MLAVRDMSVHELICALARVEDAIRHSQRRVVIPAVADSHDDVEALTAEERRILDELRRRRADHG
jgi:hypothetical protein